MPILAADPIMHVGWWRGGGAVVQRCDAIYMQNELNTHRKHAQMKRANAYAITQTHGPCKRRKKGREKGVKKTSAGKNQLKVFLCLQGMIFPGPIVHPVGGRQRRRTGELWRSGSSSYSIASAEPNPPGASSPLTPLNDTSGAAARRLSDTGR